MADVTASSGGHRDTGLLVMWVVIALVVVGLAIAGVARYRYRSETSEAVDKAAQVAAEWEALGINVPSQDFLVRLYGTDGGILCLIAPDDVAKGLYLMQLSNGAAGPGQRPVIVRETAIAAERAMLEVYCPDRIAAFDEIVNDLKLASET